MRVIRWVEQPDGDWVWTSEDRAYAKVYTPDERTWRTCWFVPAGERRLRAEFDCAEDACAAAEKHWPLDEVDGWFESRRGGYFRKANHTAFYVRRDERGWYAVQADGKLLGRHGRVLWFGTAVEACKAVDKARFTLVDHDPFVRRDDELVWIKLTKKRQHAESPQARPQEMQEM